MFIERTIRSKAITALANTDTELRLSSILAQEAGKALHSNPYMVTLLPHTETDPITTYVKYKPDTFMTWLLSKNTSVIKLSLLKSVE